VSEFLLNDACGTDLESYHRSLKSEDFTTPVCFRTDEVPDAIVEVQCPGSGWGDCELLTEYYTLTGALSNSGDPFSKRFATSLQGLLGEPPRILHLLDNASVPHGLRYFIEQTRRHGLKYWGYDPEAGLRECNFVRSHSILGLMAETYFQDRLTRSRLGEVLFDLPPHVLFDQKAALALPFWTLTRDYFSDEVRDLFPFTTVVTAEGFEDADGVQQPLEMLAARDRARPRQFLKYAGWEPSRNWGSQAVFLLGGQDAGAHADRVRRDLTQHRFWILQEVKAARELIDYVERSGNVQQGRFFAKYSGFYGPDGLLGVKSMHREVIKVHGQPDTVINVCLPDDAATGS
jgi:hypothetical protein